MHKIGDIGKSPIELDGSSLNTAIDKPIMDVTGAVGQPIHVTVNSHGFSTGDEIFIAYVTGTVEANGKWTITVINADEFELQGSSFALTYISGGKAGKDFAHVALWASSMGIEDSSHGAPWIKGTTQGHVWLKHCYFEDGGANDQTFVDQSAGGGALIDGCAFNATAVTSVKLGGFRSGLRNSAFDNAPGANPTVVVTGAEAKLEGLRFFSPGQTGICIDVQAGFCQLSNLYMNSTGRLNVAGIECSLSNIYMYWPRAAVDTYAIDLSAGSTLNGGLIDGAGLSACHAVKAAGSIVGSMRVKGLGGNGDGIVSTSSGDVITDNHVSDLNAAGTGRPFVWTAGATAKGNKGYATSATDTDGDDAITLNSETGVLTTKSLTTPAGGVYVLILNNNLITTSTRLNVTVGRAPGISQGFPQVLDVQLISGQAYIWILNQDLGTGAFNGPVNVFFAIDN
jgi:hypothetical protein